MKKLKFYRCLTCGNVVIKLVDKNVPVMCCGELMKELTPNTTDAATEKHVPVVNRNGNQVDVVVGEVLHPMQPEHFINFVVLECENGYSVKYLEPEMEAKATFTLSEGETPVAVYEYCNLHGLWKIEL